MNNICTLHWQIKKLFLLPLYRVFDKEAINEHLQLMPICNLCIFAFGAMPYNDDFNCFINVNTLLN